MSNVTSMQEPGAHIGNLSVNGKESVVFTPTVSISNLTVMGQNGMNGILDVQLLGWQVTDSLFFRGKNYRQIRQAVTMVIPLGPNASVVTPFPLRGIPRRVRIRPSTMAGVTVQQRAGALTSDLSTFLVAGQFNEPPTSTQLGVNYPAGGISDMQQILITAQPSVAVGEFVEIESEFWISDDLVTIQPSEKIVGSGSPTVNAAFVGQSYYDVVNRKFYTAVDVGKGANDWAAGA